MFGGIVDATEAVDDPADDVVVVVVVVVVVDIVVVMFGCDSADGDGATVIGGK